MVGLKKHGKPDRVAAERRGILAACGVALGVIVALLLTLPQKPGFTPPEFDLNAQVGSPTVPPELGWSELKLRQGLSVYVCGALEAREGRVAVWLCNPPDNDCWLKLRMTDPQGRILGETGLVKQGEFVQYLTLDTVPRESTPVVLKVMGYMPETYYSGGSLGLETVLTIP